MKRIFDNNVSKLQFRGNYYQNKKMLFITIVFMH